MTNSSRQSNINSYTSITLSLRFFPSLRFVFVSETILIIIVILCHLSLANFYSYSNSKSYSRVCREVLSKLKRNTNKTKILKGIAQIYEQFTVIRLFFKINSIL